MLLNIEKDPRDHSSCALSYDEVEGWMQAVWQGYVDQNEALRGAAAYLERALTTPCAYLLNDNTQLHGPWFEGTDWLLHVWVPQAGRLGLRYVAHVVQADTHVDLFTRSHREPLPFELQLFGNLEDARHWLRQQRDASEAVNPLP